MKKTYQIDKQRAAQRFVDQARASQQQVQLALPLPEVVNLVQCGLMNSAIAAFVQLAEQVMQWEVATLTGPKSRADAQRAYTRWGSQAGYCVVAGQKVPLQRPRVRDVRQREAPLGSYEMLQRASLMEDSIWNKIMHGLTTRRYSQVVRELQQAYGIEKSTVSDHFIEASRGRLRKLQARPLDQHVFCAMMIDGTCFHDQQVVVAIGLTLQGHKVVLGLHQGATENTTVVKHLLDDIAIAVWISRCRACIYWMGARRCMPPYANWAANAPSFNAARCTRSATSWIIWWSSTERISPAICGMPTPCRRTTTPNALSTRSCDGSWT